MSSDVKSGAALAASKRSASARPRSAWKLIVRLMPWTASGAFAAISSAVSGTAPGFPLGSFTVPLNPDPYLFFTLSNPNTLPLARSLVLLDAEGKSRTGFQIMPEFAALVGLTVHHAGIILRAGVKRIGNPVPVTLIP